MTTGEYLIQRLGLSKLGTPRICRSVDGAYRTFLIYVDSSSPLTAITKNRVNMWTPKVGVYKFPFADVGGVLPDRKTPTTPLMDLKDFNGILAPGNFILIDLGGRFGTKTNYTYEGKISSLENLSEEVYLSDFKNFGMSNLTQTFRKDRNLSGQTEVRTAKLIQCDLTPEGSAIFSWLTEPTELESPVTPGKKIPPNSLKYGDGKTPMEADPDANFDITKNPSKTYTVQMEIVDLLKWVDTYPDKTEIKAEDVKDILDVSAVRFWNNSPGFHWQGLNYNLSRLDGAIHPTTIAPTSGPRGWKDRHGVAFLDKHTGGIIQSLAFFRNLMASMLTKKLRDGGYLK